MFVAFVELLSSLHWQGFVTQNNEAKLVLGFVANSLFIFQVLFETQQPSGDLSWIRGVFQLPNCKTMVVRYNTLNIYDIYDCSGHVFLVLREILKVCCSDRIRKDMVFTLLFRLLLLFQIVFLSTLSQAILSLAMWSVSIKQRGSDVRANTFIHTGGLLSALGKRIRCQRLSRKL